LESSNGIFALASDPPNAKILDASGKELGVTSASEPVRVPSLPGTYQFLARLEGLADVAVTMAVKNHQTTNYTFHFDYGSVRLESTPPGASILKDGKEVAKTPATLVQKPGTKYSYQIAALNYVPVLKEPIVQSHEYNKSVPVTLEKELVNVALASDPPGAEFYTETGTALKLTGDSCKLPWGPATLIARYRRLGSQTNTVEIQPGKTFRVDPFKFIYGTLILTNLEGYTVKEGADEVQGASTPLAVSYEPPGAHSYDLYDGDAKIDTLKTNFDAGQFAVLISAVASDKRNGIGMKMVRMRNLLGKGQDAWVGKYEVTQKEYKAVMGANPSGHQLGDDYPVENVTWIQANEFCDKLTTMDRSPPSPQGKYSLPTSEQWATFAGVPELTTAVYGVAQPSRTGTKPANKAGLCDVLGNVREWLASNDPKNKDYVGGGFRSRPGFGGMGAFTNTTQVQLDQAFDDLGFRVIWLPGR
jgi:hypothetical protein